MNNNQKKPTFIAERLIYGGTMLSGHTLQKMLSCEYRVHSHAPSIRSHRGIKVVWPDFQPMRVPEEPVCVHLFRQKPVFTSLHLKSPVHVHRLRKHRTYPESLIYNYLPSSQRVCTIHRNDKWQENEYMHCKINFHKIPINSLLTGDQLVSNWMGWRGGGLLGRRGGEMKRGGEEI
jgi:hypothetical protein